MSFRGGAGLTVDDTPTEGGSMSTTETEIATQSYRLFVKATPERIWDAITRSEFTERYGYGGQVEYDLRPGGSYRAFSSDDMRAHGAPEVVVDGAVIEADSPRRLVQTWRALFGPETAAEEPGRVTWELEETEPGITDVKLTHVFGAAPITASVVGGSVPEMGGGWSYVLSDLKTLLETGRPLAG
jgi:uncharacterized protein YndB with AHSA1/START domain